MLGVGRQQPWAGKLQAIGLKAAYTLQVFSQEIGFSYCELAASFDTFAQPVMSSGCQIRDDRAMSLQKPQLALDNNLQQCNCDFYCL